MVTFLGKSTVDTVDVLEQSPVATDGRVGRYGTGDLRALPHRWKLNPNYPDPPVWSKSYVSHTFDDSYLSQPVCSQLDGLASGVIESQRYLSKMYLGRANLFAKFRVAFKTGVSQVAMLNRFSSA